MEDFNTEDTKPVKVDYRVWVGIIFIILGLLIARHTFPDGSSIYLKENAKLTIP
jgi:hypothetical protein